MADQTGLDASLFTLDPDEFIDACAQQLGLTEQELPDADRAFLRGALFAGKPRLAVLDAILRHKRPHDGRRDLLSPLNAVALDSGPHFLADLLLRFAPDDEEAFLAHVFPLIVGRPPEEFERLPLSFDLRHKRIDRQTAIGRLIDTARREGRVVHCTPPRGSSAVPERPAHGGFPEGAGLDAKGRATFPLCHRLPGGGWSMAPEFLRQQPEVKDDVWYVRPGFVLSGPNTNLTPGLWRIALDVVQAEDAIVTLDVVANGALDQLMQIEIVGSFDGAVAVAIRPHHYFVELRLSKPEQDKGLMWLRMGRLQLVRLGDLPETP